MALTLMYITNNPQIAQIAQSAGVDRIWVDLEYLGKEDRQGGMDTVKSRHTIDDIRTIRPVVTTSELLVRINPIHDAGGCYGSMEDEIEQVIDAGADVYIDMISSKVVSIFTKKKLVMRAGEKDKAVSFKDEKLFELIQRFSEEAGFCGQIDIDIFEVDGEYYISEVNPRFGGGYPHAYECGCDHMRMIIHNLCGNVKEQNVGAYEENIVR